MAGKDTEDNAYYGPVSAAYARERDLRTRDTRIFIDLGKSEREEREECWSLGLGLARKMQRSGADGQ